MTTYKIVLPNEAPIKKNQAKSAWTRKDKNGNIIPLSNKATWYSKSWNTYAKLAVQRLYVWKQVVTKKYIDNLPHRKLFPLTGQYVVSMIFFRTSVLKKIDLENLEGGILDILAGNSGLKIPKKSAITHEDYKIFADDSIEFIKNHGASTCFLNPTNPHTEIFISEFTLDKFREVFKLWHPDATLGWIPDSLFNNTELI